jgi:NifB/MoaA-like Fe-S oxidoreductase
MMETARDSAVRESTDLVDSAARQAKAIQQGANVYREQAIAAVNSHRDVLNDLTERIAALREQWAQSHIAITEQVARAGTHFAQAENRANELSTSLQERREELSNLMANLSAGIRSPEQNENVQENSAN